MYVPYKYFGLVKFGVLPPKKLYAPILPSTINKKLLFPLCRTCAEELTEYVCHHNDKERSIYGTWCTVELDYAISKLDIE